MRITVALVLGVSLCSVSCGRERGGVVENGATSPTSVADPAASEPGTVSESAISCWLLAGSVTSTSPASLQGSASISCSPGSSDLYILGTMEQASSTNGPWTNWSDSSKYGSGTYLSTITYAPRVCGYYYRMKAYGRWYDGGWKENTKLGYASRVYC